MAKVKLGNVKGSKGDKGDRGSLWRVSDKMTGQSTSGTAFPGAGFEDSVVNDICLNPVTFDLYRCQTAGNAAAAKWVWECNIKGATGPKGDKGDPTTVDAVLSKDSTNPIQNKAVATKFQDVQDSLDKKVTHRNGVNPSLYRPGNELIELGIEFIARNGHLVAFYIFGAGVDKKLVLWDVTDNREVWHI